MSEFVRALNHARIRAKHENLSDLAIRDELIWELYGIRVGSR